MLASLLALALASPSSDAERFAHVADAAARIQDRLEAYGCMPPRGYRDRAIARLTMAEDLPHAVVELSYDRVLAMIEVQARTDCALDALDPPGAVTAFREPEVPECARDSATAEIASAGWLADHGYEDAANAVAELAVRWDRTKCPGRRAEARRDAWESAIDQDPKWCSCGGKQVRPSDVWYGYGASTDTLHYELDLAQAGSCEVAPPFGYCPEGCIATDWYRPDRRNRPADGQLQNTDIEESDRAIEVVHGAGAGASRPVLSRILTERAADCHGTVEWLGEWVPYSEDATCIVDAIDAIGWTPKGWVIVDT